MDYRSLKIDDGDNKDEIILSREEIDKITARVEEQQGIVVESTKNKGNGISFMGPYDIALADFSYSTERGKLVLKLNKNANKQYKEQVEKERKKAVRKYILQKYVLPISGAVIIGAGILTSVGHAKNILFPKVGTEVSVEENVNKASLSDAEIPVVLAWANYAINEYYDSAASSQYSDTALSFYERVYQEDFVPLCSAYESYYELINSGLPQEMVVDAAMKKLGEIKSSAHNLNKSLSGDMQFEETPFSQAIILDEDAEDKYAQEVDVYIPLSTLEDTLYSVDNLPGDAIIHNGEVYVLSNHLYDKEMKSSKSLN